MLSPRYGAVNVIAASDLPNAPGPHWRIGALASDKYSALTLNLKSGALMSAFSTYQMIFSVLKSRFTDSGNDWIRTSDLALMKRPLCR